MNPAQQLYKEHSRRNTDLIVEWIGHDRKRFNQVIILLNNKDLVLVQRSSWVVKNSLIINPEWISPCSKTLLKVMKKQGQHEGVIRHMLSIFEEGRIPVRYEAEIMDACFRYFMNASSAIAVRVISMSILAKLSCKYSEIRNELIGLIRLEIEKGAGPAMNARAKRVLKDLEF